VHILTILNQVEKHKSFVYQRAQWSESKGKKSLEIQIVPRKNSPAICSGCQKTRSGYDHLPERRFEFVPFWGILVFFVYRMRRVDCPGCGVTVEQVPWAVGKQSLCTSYGWFLARWARRMNWTETARAFHTSWYQVATAVEMAVVWGRQHMDLNGITALGVDELCWGQGHRYLTVVYQINQNAKRLLWVGEKRSAATLRQFFDWLKPERCQLIQYVCTDMWKPFLKVIAQKAPQAINILDRFHIMAHLSKAIDKIRAEEARQMKRRGLEPLLVHSRWCLLKRPDNLTDKQTVKLKDLVQYNLKTIRAYLLKEDFQLFWTYLSPAWAARFLDQWTTRVMRSRLTPMKKVASMLRNHRPLILNWFKAKGTLSSAVVEGLNNKAKLTTRKAFGFSTLKWLEIALYHQLGDLPTPLFTHDFF
jgi:transposase